MIKPDNVYHTEGRLHINTEVSKYMATA